MPTPSIGTPTSTSTAGQVIQSIRDMIPDPTPNNDPGQDGTAYSLLSLLRWMNDALRIMATSAPIIQDWVGLASEQGMDLYNLPTTTLSVEQLWYDNTPCYRAPEWQSLFVNMVQGRSYYFGPHSIHQQPRLQVWPACDRTAATTTLSSTISATDTIIPVVAAGPFRPYGFFDVEGEIILYRGQNAAATQFLHILRGQSGTTPAAHNNGAAVHERNIMMKVSRLPTPLAGVNDVIEIPVGLTPLIEVYVLSKVRESEQDHQAAQMLRGEFTKDIQALETKNPVPGLRQGLQVRDTANAPILWGGRVYIP